MNDCPYCRIVSGKLDTVFVYQDEICSAFMSFQPINPGHMVLVPNEHYQALEQLPETSGSHLFLTGRRLALTLSSSGVQCESVNLYLAAGWSGETRIPHLHLHIIPRYEGDGFQFQFSGRYAEIPPRDELEKNAYHIKMALGEMPDQD